MAIVQLYQFCGALRSFWKCFVAFGCMYLQVAAICGQSVAAILVLGSNTKLDKIIYIRMKDNLRVTTSNPMRISSFQTAPLIHCWHYFAASWSLAATSHWICPLRRRRTSPRDSPKSAIWCAAPLWEGDHPPNPEHGELYPQSQTPRDASAGPSATSRRASSTGEKNMLQRKIIIKWTLLPHVHHPGHPRSVWSPKCLFWAATPLACSSPNPVGARCPCRQQRLLRAATAVSWRDCPVSGHRALPRRSGGCRGTACFSSPKYSAIRCSLVTCFDCSGPASRLRLFHWRRS